MWGQVLAGVVLAAALAGGQALVVSTAYGKGDKAGWDRRDAAAWQASARASEAGRAAERLARDAAHAVDAQHAAAAAQIRTVYRTIEREIPAHVTPAMDARFPLSVGWVRAHDAAALGLSPAAVDPAGGPDDAASPVTGSEAAFGIRTNYETAAACARQLSDLQDLIRGQPGYPR